VLTPRKDDLPVDPSAEPPSGYNEDQRGEPGGFTGDPDVFDTWATSALTPLIPSGWPDDMARHERLYPNDLRPQAHEIIRTWTFVTITRSYLEDGSIPWYHAAISGFIVDPDRKKMSKSKGNVVLPTDVLDEFGSDAVRYWSASGRLGVDTTTDPNVFREGKRLVTKIRNAARLVRGYEGEPGEPTHPLDRGLIARLRKLVEEATGEWESWDHARALDLTETWFWSDFTDNYLELSKTRAYAGDPSALGTLHTALDAVLRLFAPVVPFITEEVWNQERSEPTSIHREPWPVPDELPAAEDDGCFDVAVEVLARIRKAKSEAKVSIKWPVTDLSISGSRTKLDLLTTVLDDVLSTGNVRRHSLTETEGDDVTVEVTLEQQDSA
jgi:valyl-tRNA synthetase